MKLLIFGGNGWIGKKFTNYLQTEGIDYHNSENRADDTIAVTAEIADPQYTHIVSMIGRTSGVYNGELINTIDYLEKPGMIRYNVRDNLFAPLSLAIISSKHNKHFTYLGTGCIFDYDDLHSSTVNPRSEEDLPNFFGSSYSTVKGFTDRLMHMFSNVLNLRIRMPISCEKHPRNFITKITQYEKICDMPNSMTVLETFFPIFTELIKHCHVGTVNCTNPGVISHNEILTMYRDIVDNNFTWKNFTIEEQDKVLASKRSNNYLDTTKLTTLFDHVPDIHTAVKNALENYS